MLERGDVRADRIGPVDDLDDRRAGEGSQPRRFFDLILEPGDQVPEVGDLRTGNERVTPGDARGDLLGASPVDW